MIFLQFLCTTFVLNLIAADEGVKINQVNICLFQFQFYGNELAIDHFSQMSSRREYRKDPLQIPVNSLGMLC